MTRMTVVTELKCSECNSIMPIARRLDKQKGNGHIKHMWCYKCKKVTAHIEGKDGKEQ